MEQDFLLIVGIGFLAQIIDGALGMAYGVTTNAFLLALGIPPATASASVHAAEIFTTGASGLSHLALRNVDRRLLTRLLIPGVLGAIVGACLLSFLPVNPIRFVVALYLACMGTVILRKSWKKSTPTGHITGKITGLGLAGGFFDALGGGGWGPIVTSTLVARGGEPRFTIGSVNAAEFFIALAASFTFFLTIGLGYWRNVLGLVLGGVLAAPLAAFLCKRIPGRALMLLVGMLIILLSLRAMAQVLGWHP
jgi:hypothetical protein